MELPECDFSLAPVDKPWTFPPGVKSSCYSVVLKNLLLTQSPGLRLSQQPPDAALAHLCPLTATEAWAQAPKSVTLGRLPFFLTSPFILRNCACSPFPRPAGGIQAEGAPVSSVCSQTSRVLAHIKCFRKVVRKDLWFPLCSSR